MTKFGEGEWYKIAGRGWVFSTKNPEDCENFNHILHKEVEIEGKIYTCIGIEYMGFASFRKDRPIGLLVRGERQ